MEKLRNTLLVFLMFGMGSFFAQTDTTGAIAKRDKRKTTYEMGMNITSLTLRAGDFYSQYYKQLDNQIFSGLYLKCFRRQNAMRFSIDYSQRNVYARKQPSGDVNRIKSLELKIGYQRMLGKRKLAAYVFADLEYNYIRRQGLWNGGFYPNNFDYFSNGSYDFSNNFLCASPGFGLRWKVAKSIVLNAESGAQFFYVRENNADNALQKNTSLGINAKILKISIGFTF